MAGIRNKLALAFEGGLQAPEHAVECIGQLAQFILALHVQAAAQVGLADCAGGLRDGVNRTHGPVGQPEATQQGNDQGCQAAGRSM